MNMESLAIFNNSYSLSSPSHVHLIPKNPRPSRMASLQSHRQMPKLEIRCAAQAQSTDPKSKEAKLWGGRFEKSVTDAVERFTESISFDKALYKHDIMGSKAHASMLAKQVHIQK